MLFQGLNLILGRQPVFHSLPTAWSLGLRKTYFSVLQFQESLNANLLHVERTLEKMEHAVLRPGSSGAERQHVRDEGIGYP